MVLPESFARGCSSGGGKSNSDLLVSEVSTEAGGESSPDLLILQHKGYKWKPSGDGGAKSGENTCSGDGAPPFILGQANGIQDDASTEGAVIVPYQGLRHWLVSVWNHEFWLMGFVNYGNTIMHLQEAIRGFHNLQAW